MGGLLNSWPLSSPSFTEEVEIDVCDFQMRGKATMSIATTGIAEMASLPP